MKWRQAVLFRPWKRHSLVLTIAGLAYIGMGVTMVNAAGLTPIQETALTIALRMAPIYVWGALFIFCGVCSILSSRWPTFSDSWGYAVLCGLSTGWGVTYILGYFIADAPPITGLVTGLVWSLMGFMWWGISGLMSPPKKAVLDSDSD